MANNLSLRRIYWASQETVSQWQPAVTNSAGSLDLASTGILMCGAPVRGQTLLWTTTDLWSMTYIGQPFIYRADKIGDECGIISAHAFVTQDSLALWMGLNGFFAYDGYVMPIPCEVQDYVFGSLNRANAYKIVAFLNAAFGEATWFYPSAGAVDNDRYVTYNTRERHWTFGNLARSAGVSFAPGVSVGPVLLGSDGTIYDHETGNVRGGVAAFVESGPVEIGNGDTVCSVNRLIPDENNLGEVQLMVYGQYRPMGVEVAYGPFTMANEPANVRVKARQVRLRFTEVVATAWRVGIMRVGIVLGGRR